MGHYIPRATRGRRSLESALSPTEAFKACEADPAKDQEQCEDVFTDMVDQMLTFEADHPEGFVELTGDMPENDEFDMHVMHMQEEITTLRNGVNQVLNALSAQIEYMQENFEMSSKKMHSDMDETRPEDVESNTEGAVESESSATGNAAVGQRRHLSGVSRTLQRLLKH